MPVNLQDANALLDLVDRETIARLACELIDLQAGDTLHHSGARETFVHFPVTAVLALVTTMATGDSSEVALVGREGMVGLSTVLGGTESPTTCIARIAGTCLRASAAAVAAARERNPLMRAAIDRYITSRLIQVAHVAACGRLHPIGNRLARSLLALQDRIDADRIKLSQQRIADALGVHRPTIALELQRLDAAGGIRYRDRAVTIVDRARLEQLACECHVAQHREFVMLFHPLVPPRADDGTRFQSSERHLIGV